MLTPGNDLIPSGPREAPGWTLWLAMGLGARLEPELSGLDALAGAGRLFLGPDDLAALLGAPVGPGRLVVASQAVPPEDVGILRRFLARHGSRELVVLHDPQAGSREDLQVLPRTRLFPLELGPALFAYLRQTPEGANEPRATTPSRQRDDADRLALSWQLLKERLAERTELAPLLGRLEVELGRAAEDASAPRSELIDLGVLAEELLAGFSLEREQRMRFLFKPEGELSIRAPRHELELCLHSLFDLVRRSSSPDSVIRVRVTSTSGSQVDPDAPVDAMIEFPDQQLADLPVGAELDPDAVARHFGPEVSSCLRLLRKTAADLGAELSSPPTRPGRRRVQLRLPRLLEAAIS